LVCSLPILASCGGAGGSTITPPPPPAITVIVAPTSATVQTGATFQFTPTVDNDSSDKGVTLSLSGTGCSGATCGDLSANSAASGAAITYTAPSTVPSSSTVTFTATSVADGTKSATATITVTSPTGAKPTITVSGDPSTATAGGTETVSFKVTGSPTVSCTSQTFGSMTVSGTTASVAVPKTAASGIDTPTCTAVNSFGQAQGSTQITIQAATTTPTINSVSSATGGLFSGTPGLTIPAVALGSGFQIGGTLITTYVDGPPVRTLLTSTNTPSSSQINASVSTGAANPGVITFQVDNTAVGGGLSNIVSTLLLPNVKTTSFTLTSAGDPVDIAVSDYYTGVITGYKVSNGSKDPNLNIPNLFGTLAWAPGAETLLMGDGGYVLTEPSGTGGTSTTDTVSGIATLGNTAFFSEFPGQVGCFIPSTGGLSTTNYVTVGNPANQKWLVSIASLTLADGTPVAVVYDANSAVATFVDMSSCTSPNILGTVALPFTKALNLGYAVGFWELASSSGGSLAVLSTVDGLVVGINPSTMAITYTTKKLSGIPNAIALNSDGAAVVASWTFTSPQQTTFVNVNLQGEVTSMDATFSHPCDWVDLTPDGTEIYCEYDGAETPIANQ
jgi:hypothetical protein